MAIAKGQNNNPWVYKSTKTECVSGNCKNGRGVAILHHKFKQKDNPTLSIGHQYVVAEFRDGKLNGNATIASSNISEKDFKKLKIPANTTSFTSVKFSGDGTKVYSITDCNFKDNIPVGSITYYDQNWLANNGVYKRPGYQAPVNSEWLFTEADLYEYRTNDAMENGGSIIYGVSKSLFASDLFKTTDEQIFRVDSVIVFLADNGKFKRINQYKTIKKEDNNDRYKVVDYDVLVSSYSEMNYKGVTIKRLGDHELGWDLVIKTENGKTDIWRELNFSFKNEVVTSRYKETSFSFPNDQDNYAELHINDSTTYKGGTNGNGTPHGFGVLTTRVKQDKNEWLNAKIDSYEQYSGYFYLGNKKYGRNFDYTIITNETSGDTTKMRWTREYQGSFSNNKPFGWGKLITYYNVDYIDKYYDGTWYGDRNSIYPNKGQFYNLRNNNSRLSQFNTQYASGYFDEKGVYVTDLPGTQRYAKWYECFPMSTVIVYNGVKALVVARDEKTATLTLSDKRTTTGFNTNYIIDMNGNPNDYLCLCPACNGSGYYSTTDYRTEVESYNKQDYEHINYLGLDKVSTYKVTEVKDISYQVKHKCATCNGSGWQVCK